MRAAFASAFVVWLAACGQAPAPPDLPEGPVIEDVQTAPGVTLHVETYGDGANVVIVPGRLFLDTEFRTLAAPDRTIILYDMRNRGASSRVEDVAVLNILEDVRDLEALRAHAGAARVSLIGYSYLGLMTALYAAEHPDRVERLVQIGPVARRYNTEWPEGERAGEETLSDEARAAGARWEAAQAAATPDANQSELCRVQEAYYAYWNVGDPAKANQSPDTCQYENEWPVNTTRHFGAHFADLQTRDFPAATFSALTLPVLTIHGTIDRNAAYGGGREWARTFPDGRLITIQDGAHRAWIDDPTVMADIDGFLRGRWPVRAEQIR